MAHQPETSQQQKLTALVYYHYHIMVRQNVCVCVLLRAKRLFPQFLVDTYCKIETEWLQFLDMSKKHFVLIAIRIFEMRS